MSHSSYYMFFILRNVMVLYQKKQMLFTCRLPFG